MKKLFFASLVVLGALTMPSCGEKKPESTETTDSAAAPAEPMTEPMAADTTTAAPAADSSAHADSATTAPAH